VLMGVLDGRADVLEETQPFARRQPSRLAVRKEGLALDVLHDEVRLARRGRSAVEEPCDVRMVQRRRDLALATEASERDFVRQAAGDELYRDPPLKLVVGAPREIDDAHAPPADLGEQLVWPDPLALPGAWRSIEEGHRHGCVENVVAVLGGGRQGLDVLPELLVGAAGSG